LRGLSEGQLHQLLLNASRYGSRTVRQYDLDSRTAWVTHFLPPTRDQRSLSLIDVDRDILPHIEISVDSEIKDQYADRQVDIAIPYAFIGGSEKVFPAISDRLKQQGLPQMHWTTQTKLRKAMEVYNNPIRDPLDEHNYGDGRIKTGFETLESLLAQEISDLTALKLDFDDVVERLDGIVQDIHHAVHESRTLQHTESTALPYQFVDDGESPTEASTYLYRSKAKPEWRAKTIQWKYNVVLFPFPIETSILDHRIYKAANPGFAIPISETSLDLYKHRVVEGFYLGHYRISAARTVWATEWGSPELQAQAFGLDWQHTTDAMYQSRAHGTNGERASILRHILSSFPEDCAQWQESGFAGYSWKGTEGEEQHFQHLADWADAAAGSYPELKNYRQTGKVIQIMNEDRRGSGG
jgi:hypothetical protein